MIFTEYDNDRNYKSVYKAAMKFGCTPYESDSMGTSRYHCDSVACHFVWTDGVGKFVSEHSCVWLLLLLETYLNDVSKVTVEIDKNGHITWKENNAEGTDDFLLIFLQKTACDEAVFTIERDNGVSIQTIKRQFIPYTDIDVDTVLLYLESGVLLFPSEH